MMLVDNSCLIKHQGGHRVQAIPKKSWQLYFINDYTLGPQFTDCMLYSYRLFLADEVIKRSF
jgi:hypothetical protein